MEYCLQGPLLELVRLIGDDYPSSWKNRPSEYDTWGYNKSTCTSFVAYRLHNVNKFETPRGLGDAGNLGNSARSRGYTVNNTPAVGSVAWEVNNGYGHVAWVAAVNGNNITVEEYNWNWDYSYHTRNMSASHYAGFIHFKDLSGNGSNSSNPTPNTGGSGNLPSSGRYTFTSRLGIKSEPKISSPDIAYYDSGDSVYYDRTLNADGYQWISYNSYSGVRRYIAVNKINSTVTPVVKGNIVIQNKNDQAGTFDVVITNVSSNSGLREVQVPIWSEQNGQYDIIWYRATKQNNGDYKTTVNISNHKNNRGDYNIHLYYVIDSGKLVGVGGTKINIPSVNNQNQKPNGTVKIENRNDGSGSFDVIISNIACPKGLKEVKVPTWTTKDGQDDIIWYTAQLQSNGSYKVTVKPSEHKNEGGEYNVHVYFSQNDGSLEGIAALKTTVNYVTRPSIPDSGSYRFSGHASVRAEAKVSSPELAYYESGNTVNYDRVLLSDGHYWISYIAASGNRRYISIT